MLSKSKDLAHMSLSKSKDLAGALHACMPESSSAVPISRSMVVMRAAARRVWLTSEHLISCVELSERARVPEPQ